MFQVESLICMALLFGRTRGNYQRHGRACPGHPRLNLRFAPLTLSV
jgi:hypothetical protein